MTTSPNSVASTEQYEDFEVGDDVWCLAWLGMPFTVIAKDDQTRRISLEGTAPCSLPEGAQVDIDPASQFLISHNMWDQIWYWPDRAGETYREVFDRFVSKHHEGDLVTGYNAVGLNITPDPNAAVTFRLSFAALLAWNQVFVQPVVAVATNGSDVAREYDPAIANERWVPCAPAASLRIQMHYYRWALVYGPAVLNWEDFGLV